MNIGEIRKNANGQLIGSVETLTITRTIGLRPVTSSNPRAPKFEIVALNDQRRWVIVGAVGYSRMLGRYADSPVVAIAGSKNQFLAALGVGYTF